METKKIILNAHSVSHKKWNEEDIGDKKELLCIDYTLINSLKREGKYAEAKLVLKQFHEEGRKVKKQELNNIYRVDRRIKKHGGVCSNTGCFKPVKKWLSRCESCYNSDVKSHKKNQIIQLKE